MWFNSTQREEPYLGSNGFSTPVEMPVSRKGVESRCCMAVVSSTPLPCGIPAFLQIGTRRTLPGLERLLNAGRNAGIPQGSGVEVLHGCRQLDSTPLRDTGISTDRNAKNLTWARTASQRR